MYKSRSGEDSGDVEILYQGSIEIILIEEKNFHFKTLSFSLSLRRIFLWRDGIIVKVKATRNLSGPKSIAHYLLSNPRSPRKVRKRTSISKLAQGHFV